MMGLQLWTLFLAAVIVLGIGVRMMYCGHRHQVRRDRRSDDRRST